MENEKWCPRSVQEIASKLAEKTRLEEIDWTRTIARDEEGYRTCIENGRDKFFCDISKKEDKIFFSFGQSKKYEDGEAQFAITDLFVAITRDDDKKKERLDYYYDRVFAIKLLRILQ